MAHNNACKKQMKDKFKSLDYFGQTVTFTYDGADQFKTTFGASVSLVLILILMLFGVYKFVYLVNRWNPNVIKTSFLRDLKEEPAFRPQDLGFDFAFGIGEEIPANIGKFSVKQIEFEFQKQNDGQLKRIKKPSEEIELTSCGTELFRYEDKQEIIDLEIDQMKCLKTNDYELKGNYYAQEYKYLELKLWKCGPKLDPTLKCANETVIKKYFSDKTFSFAFINTQFVLDSYDPKERLQYFIDDSLLFEVESQRVKKANFYVQKSEGELEDSLLQFGQSELIEFHQVTNFKSYDDEYTDADGYMIAIYKRFERTYDNYERKVYGFLEFLGDVGVLQGHLYQQVCFLSDLWHSVRKYENFENQGNLKQVIKVANLTRDQIHILDQLIIVRKSTQVMGLFLLDQMTLLMNSKEQLTSKKKNNLCIEKEFKFKDKIEQKDIGNVLFAFLNRGRFSYTIQDIIHYILKCMCFRNIEENRRKKLYKRHFLFDKAQEKFGQELDAIRIVKTLRKFKMLAQALLSQKHRLVLKFQRQNLIETSSSSSDSDNNNYDTVRLMENTNPLIRLVMFGKLKKMMTGFSGKQLEPLERNMMRGMFIRKLKDFAEDARNLTENQTLLERLKGDMGLPTKQNSEIDHSIVNVSQGLVVQKSKKFQDEPDLIEDIIQGRELLQQNQELEDNNGIDDWKT
ncbi:UNKNOWN [Stylonychia lemnae]|uniref:Uncharacterized protein n=1 Tax=Stylonychia lemnae TaxID=5949 RepID=A0A078AU72_STYLE|nr:UNKNOWN [Stylonychia lemnae]|eukprot:CDW85794.1 UNKNOWN [Stylonychia lemnae]